jgi:acyl carrier protein
MQEFFELACKLLAEQLEIDPADITMETTFESIDADSIDVVEMIMALEDIYDVEFPEEDLEDYPTMGLLVKALWDYLEQVMSIVAGLPVRLSFYLLSRFLQLTFSAIITWIGYTLVITPGQMVSSLAMPTYRILYAFDAWYVSLCSLVVGLLIIAVLMIISLLMQLPKTIRP